MGLTMMGLYTFTLQMYNGPQAVHAVSGPPFAYTGTAFRRPLKLSLRRAMILEMVLADFGNSQYIIVWMFVAFRIFATIFFSSGEQSLQISIIFKNVCVILAKIKKKIPCFTVPIKLIFSTFPRKFPSHKFANDEFPPQSQNLSRELSKL